MQQYEPPAWQQLRNKADSVLQAHFLPPALYRLPDPSDVSMATMALTGFCILCDWLGSDEEVFRPKPGLDLKTYVGKSPNRAQQVLDKAGLLTPTLSDKHAAYTTLFPDKLPPRPLQEAIGQIPQAVLDGPCLAIIEAPTGEGKTEAALALAHRIAQVTECDELYYALPTTATSNQMFRRIEDYLHTSLDLPVNVNLIHGQAFLVEDDLRVEPLADTKGADRRTMLEWSTSKKRAMVAPFGVGTVDQAELAALNVKHCALRLIGLAGKVLIFDEVHAYDTYMTTIVETLLHWLSAMGTSVIILSATLPQAQRAALARAYGGDWRFSSEETRAYPSLWVLRPGHKPYHARPEAQRPNRHIEVRHLQLKHDAPEAKAQWLLDAVARDGCACWITNTVDRAQRIFEVLRSERPSDIDVMLLHARFPLEERQQLEQQVTDKYGPGGDRPRKGIVVGTQVLEQSLDLDFDVMVSDLAPIDLLLQRAGRLQRHSNKRPAAHAGEATLWINMPMASDDTPDLEIDERIYDAFLLRRTYQVLEGHDAFQLPHDYRCLVEAVYGITEMPRDESLGEAWQGLRRKQSNAVKEARQRLLPDPDPEWSFVSRAAQLAFEEDETSAAWIVAQTRLGRESINLIPLERESNAARLYPTQDTVALEQRAPRETQLRLLRRHLRVSRPEIVKAVKAYELPELFKSARLRGYYPLWLTAGQVEFPLRWGRLLVRLDPELGLVIQSERDEKGA